ncbi:uncharacterized protein LOC129593772 [Paramacrobiotus metropolitanus]|uniref:uncharacterized protein LOC129593772 n=1 Tax=Paramacrobiotus metropolitanus TaxID=2943436 RepID=UPI002445D477|nr:uncharacterized protein LOC129593772 [Paramacrobiotus metropolitanus]
MDFINSALQNITGWTYSECCQELGIFREAYCFVTMRVPLRSLQGEMLSAFRLTIPECPALAEVDALKGTDNVVLKTRQGRIEVDREILVRISPRTRAIFVEGEAGQVRFYETNYSKAAVVMVLSAAMTQNASLPTDPRRAAPFFLYEMMKLVSSWEIPQLQLWTQLAFVERLCHPVANLDQIPVLDAVWIIGDHADPRAVGSRMILCALVGALRYLHSPAARWTLDELMALIAEKPALWKSVFLPTRLLPDIGIKNITGKSRMVTVNLAYWVYQLKCLIWHQEGIPQDQQRLVFDGRALEDNVTLADCGIVTNATVHLCLRLRGC